MNTSDVAGLIEQVNSAVLEFKANFGERLLDVEKRLGRPGTGASNASLHGRTQLNQALRKYMRYGDDSEIKAMSIGSDPDGGYVVPELLATTMTAKAFELSPFREFARVIPISSTSWKEPADIDQPGTSWVAETSGRPETTAPKLGMLEITAHEQYAMPAVTQQLLEDSGVDLAGWLEGKIASRFLRDEAAAVAAGDGIQKPRGILTHAIVSTADANRPWGDIQYIPTGAAADFIAPTTSASPADCLIDTIYSMKSTYRRGARWYMNSLTAGKVRKFKDAQGRFVWTDTLIAGQPSLLLGYPVTTAEDMPVVGSNAYPVMFANLNPGYTIVDRVGVSVLRDPFSAKPNVLFYTRRRVGGAVSNSEAIKLVKCATS